MSDDETETGATGAMNPGNENERACIGTEIDPTEGHQPEKCHAGCDEDCPDMGMCWCGCGSCSTEATA